MRVTFLVLVIYGTMHAIALWTYREAEFDGPSVTYIPPAAAAVALYGHTRDEDADPSCIPDP